MREIEVKLRAGNLAELVGKLTEHGCVLSPSITQHDTVYSEGTREPWTKPQAGQVVLRIRREPSRTLFTLKQQRTNELDNTEIEFSLTNPDAMHRMLAVLGWTPVVEVKKTRRQGKFKEYEVCLDEVEHLGAFVELEKLASDDADPVQITEELFVALETLGLSRADQEKRGYDTQLVAKGVTL